MQWRHRPRPSRRDVAGALLRWYLTGSAVLVTAALVVGLLIAPGASLGVAVLAVVLGAGWRLVHGWPGRRRTAAEAEAGVDELEAWLYRHRPR